MVPIKSHEKNKELISILVPLYNVENFVHQCVESLLSQTYECLEFIFINDASTDNTYTVLLQSISKFPNRSTSIKIIQNTKNCGLSAVRNIAISHASGNYIVFVDGDDFLESDAIDRLYKKELCTGADIVVGDFFYEYKNNRVEYKHPKNLSQKAYFWGIIQRSIPCCIWGKLIRKDLFIRNKIKSIEDVQFGEDFVLTTRLVYKTQNITFLHYPIYHYVKTNQNSMTNKLSERSINDLLKVNAVLFDYFFNQEINYQLKLYTKILLLKQLSSLQLLETASQIYPELTLNKHIKIKDRILLFLAMRSCFNLLLCLKHAYFRLKAYWNFLFGRIRI